MGKRGEGITAPIEATPQKDLRKIQAGGITKTITDYINNANGTQKIKFIPYKADTDIEIPNTMKQKTRHQRKESIYYNSDRN